MKTVSNAHTHTIFSDGVNTAQEMAGAAFALGFSGLGFSEHSPAPFDPGCAGVQNEEEYRATIAALKQEYAGRMSILCGMEQDFDGPVNRDRYEYILGSVHYLNDENGRLIAIDGTPEHVLSVQETVFSGDGIGMAKAFYEKTVRNVQSYKPDIVGHFDLLVKHNKRNLLFDEQANGYKEAALQALDAVADIVLPYGGIVEVNTGGMARGYRSLPYPAPFLLRHLLARGVRVMINSDSHSIETLRYAFTETQELLRHIGFKSVVILQKDQFMDVML